MILVWDGTCLRRMVDDVGVSSQVRFSPTALAPEMSQAGDAVIRQAPSVYMCSHSTNRNGLRSRDTGRAAGTLH